MGTSGLPGVPGARRGDGAQALAQVPWRQGWEQHSGEVRGAEGRLEEEEVEAFPGVEGLWTGKEGGPGEEVLASGVKEERRGQKVPWGTGRVCSPWPLLCGFAAQL